MISRFVTAAALTAGVALLCLPAQAQTGTTTPSPRAFVAPANPAAGAAMLSQGGIIQEAQATTGARRVRGGDMAERRMTECLNNAAAQRQSFDSCRR